MNVTDLNEIKNLYRNDGLVKKFLDWLSKNYQRNMSETKVETIASALDIPKHLATQIAKKLADTGCCQYNKGRTGKHVVTHSRISWGNPYPMQEVIKAAKGEVSQSESSMNESKEQEDIKVIPHSFYLRPDFNVQLTLPQDITSLEAERLAKFIRTTSLEGVA